MNFLIRDVVRWLGAEPARQGLERLALTGLLIALCSNPCRGAQVSGSIEGTVTDASGAPVPSATVSAKNVETQAIREGVTDEGGRYLVVSLPVGEYEVRVKKAGFQEVARSGIRLVIGQDARVDVTLQVSAVKAEVRVTEDAPIVSTTTNDISGLV